jgi:hypothetical protein
MAKYKIGECVFFIKLRDGIMVGHDSVDEIHETREWTEYKVGGYTHKESHVFTTKDQLKTAFNAAIEKLAEPVF